MEEEADRPSSAPALSLELLVLARWRRAASRREEVRRLPHLAAEEADLAERASVLAYCAELLPGVVHAAEVRVAPEWGPYPAAVAAPRTPAQEEFHAQSSPLGPFVAPPLLLPQRYPSPWPVPSQRLFQRYEIVCSAIMPNGQHCHPYLHSQQIGTSDFQALMLWHSFRSTK